MLAALAPPAMSPHTGGAEHLSVQSLGQLTAGGKATAVNLRALSPFQRALVFTDGTVTKLIEAYTLEPLDILRLADTHAPALEHHPWLEVDELCAVGKRDVIIQGRYSRTLYVYAESLVVPERLPLPVRERLDVQGEGLGRLLNEAKIETRREVLWYARESAADLPEEVRRVSDGEFITRVYRIIARGLPVALITERFPCTLGHLSSRE